MNTLYGISYSPWSQRARWALDHHQIAYRYRDHAPLLGERALTRRARKAGLTGKATVPLLITADGTGHGDSWDIMCYADRHGTGASLQTDAPEVAGWITALEPVLQDVRVRVTRRTLADRRALTEAAATAVPAFIAPLARPVAALGAKHLAKKYGFSPEGGEDHAPLRGALERTREKLGGGDHLFGTFSAADIVSACLMNAVRPHASLTLGPATFEAWHVPALAEAFADLLEWRDRIFDRYR